MTKHRLGKGKRRGEAKREAAAVAPDAAREPVRAAGSTAAGSVDAETDARAVDAAAVAAGPPGTAGADRQSAGCSAGPDAAAGAAGAAGTAGAGTAADDGAPRGGDTATDPGATEAVGAAGNGASRDQEPAQAPAAEAEQIDQLSAQVAALQHELLRKQADLENFRKRMNRDKEEAIKFANGGLLLDLTAVLDDFERAISAAAQSEEFATLYSGIELIEKQLLGTLERKWGLIRFDSAGQPFDPERHEALATEPSAEHPEATVLEDYQKGYTLHGRVIRAARVRVATPLEGARGAAEATDSGTEGGSEEGA